ncbi:MAG: tRNA (adenosine(37)-N6)-threonylcarbamoyltransferase complex ATPase subunit type 1 TsaE [Clostridia bacterium]|nr:tRNA (adenosine(37)-N6)-threonylcarbamoyltransferase complex ATPase subunit type 1 TsaE [Clostridia bacterium]
MMNFPMSIVTHSPEETRAVGRMLAEALEADKSLPSFVAMFGDLGVGKTAFVSGFAEVLAPGKQIKSPTFALVHEYRLRDKRPLFHFDMYRIESDDELYAMGYDEYLDSGICIAEWCENIMESLPRKRIEVTISKTDEGVDVRHIEILKK